MDDDTREAIERLQRELGELRTARSGERTAAAADVREARADLEDMLRREGYRFTRSDLDRLAAAEDERLFEQRLEAYLDRKAKEDADVAGADDDEDDEDDEDGGKKKAKKKAAGAAAPADDDEEEEWT